MIFQIDDRVVYPTCGIGRIVGLVTKSFFEAGARRYYEVASDDKKSTVWVPVEASTANGLRPLTPKARLTHYRSVLRGRPKLLVADHRQRRLNVLGRLKSGLFQDVCEIVRDLTAHGWLKTLSEGDRTVLRRALERLCEEWAAADGVSILVATAEVNALLLEARQTYQIRGQ